MLQDKDRLAVPHTGHELKRTKYGFTRYWTAASKFDLMNRLGEYEDTGYSPEEIKSIRKTLKEFTGETHE